MITAEFRDALVKYLQKNGMRATSVGSASAMDAALKVGQFDLIVLDVIMPARIACRFADASAHKAASRS